MNLHEFQAKQLFRVAGIPVPEGEVVDTPSAAVGASRRLSGEQWMVKAQVHAGARMEAGGIRRAGKKIKQENADKDGIDQLDVGFRVLKVDTSNMNDVYYSPDEFKQDDLFFQVDNIRQDRSAEDLLFQVLLDWGVDLTLPIRKETIQGKDIFIVDKNSLVACFETGVDETLVKELAGFEPLRAVFRDNGFVSDAVKINVEQIFKQLSPSTEVKSI